MAIKWKKQVKGTDGRYTHEWKPDGTSHEGLVVTPSWVNHSVRIMSDVWENQTCVKVWDPEAEEVKTLVIYTSGMSSRCGEVAAVDAPADIIAAYEEAEARKKRVAEAGAELRAKEEADADARRDLKEVKTGREVVVIKGRKVPVGTRGVVRWLGATEWGYRVGITVQGQDKLVYTSIQNCEAIVAGLEPDETPVGGWAAYRDAVIAAERATVDSRPSKGHRVRIIADGTEGTMFWINGDRCGVDPRPAKEQRGRCPDPIWVQISEVERLNGNRSVVVASPVAVPAPKKAVLPAPYDMICFIDGTDGLNRRGAVVAQLTKNGIAGLVAKNPDVKVLI
jgi:hypothetical protein